MPETVYPISCRSCSKSLYGPVKYCPYCGIVVETAPTVGPLGEPEDVGQGREQSVRMDSPGSASKATFPELQSKTTPEKVSEDTAKINSEDTASKEEPAQPEEAGRQKDGFDPSESVASKQSVIAGNKDRDKVRLPWKWAAVAILLLAVIVVYFSGRDKGGESPKPPSTPGAYTPGTGGTEKPPPPQPTPPVPTTQKDGKRETARVLALEALRQGTDLSVTVGRLPKLEKARQGAQKLVEISTRYEDQLASLEITISSTRKACDRILMAYLNKVLELGRYTPEQVSYAMDIIKNGDPTPREKIVAELLTSHLSDLRNNPNPDPVKMLANFTEQFSDFVD